MRKHIVGHGHEGVFLTEEGAAVGNNSETVYVGVYHKTDIGTAFTYNVGYGGKVFGYWFGCVCKVTRGVAVQLHNVLYAECAEELRHNDAAYRIDSVDCNGEVGFGNSVDIDQRESEHLLDVPAHVGRIGIYMTEFVHTSEVEVFGFGNSENFGTFASVEELAALVEELEGVPLYGVVRSREDEAATRVLAGHSQLGGGS
jgi:hypothetical protein